MLHCHLPVVSWVGVFAGNYLMAADWRTVRVFLSSTFRDMHAERDHLIKVTFPALREKLLPHRVELYDIDLLWGITEDEAKNRLYPK